MKAESRFSAVLDEASRQFALSGGCSRRLFHGRGGCFPGFEFLTVDWFEPLLFVTVHQEAELDALVNGLREVPGPLCSSVVVQRRTTRRVENELAWGEWPDRPLAVEAGLRYRLRFGGAQNVGFFPDMRPGRALVRSRADGRKVLNLFSFTCSFSVAALAGGAAAVVNIDMNRGALALGRDNHGLNGQDLRLASFLAHDVFKSFARLRRLGPFDLVVIDPPSDQGSSFAARSGWPKVVRRLTELLAPGGEVLACLNSPHLDSGFLRTVFAECAPSLQVESRFGAGGDFPERDAERGLKLTHFVS